MAHWALKYDRKRSSRKSGKASMLDKVLLYWAMYAPFTHRNACEGILITGSNGSSKSRGSLRFITRAMLKAGYGMLVTTTKPDDAEDFVELAKEAGRAGHVKRVRPNGPFRLNPIEYLMKCSDGETITENVVHFLQDISALFSNAEERGGDPIWQKSMAMLIRNTVDLLLVAGEPVTLKAIAAVVSGSPKSLKDLHEMQERISDVMKGGAAVEPRNPYERVWLSAARNFEKGCVAIDQHSFVETMRFWTEAWPSMPDRTRGSVEFTVNATLDSMLRGQMAEILCTDTTVRPEDLFRGALVVLDFSLKVRGDEGRIVQAVFKYVFQKGLERRGLRNADPGRMCALIVDEAQEFLTPHDLTFQATARSARACTVFATQNIASLRKRLGHDGTENLTGLLQTKIFHSNDTETNEWSAHLLGQDWDYNATFGDNGVSFNEQMRHLVDPIEFARLARGGPEFNNVCEAIVFKPGAKWGRPPKPHIMTRFRTE